MLDLLYNLFRGNFIFKKIFGPIYRKYNHFKLAIYHKKERRNFKRYALEALNVFDQCMSINKRKYFLATGTLLGAIRNGGFIPHDEDIDTFMFIEDYSPEIVDELAKVGIKLRYSFSIENGKFGREDSFVFKGVQIDIFYIYPNSHETSYFTDFIAFPDCRSRKMSIKMHGGLLPRKILMPNVKDVIRIKFEDFLLPVPANSEEVLCYRYGESYMTPNPNWSALENNPNVIPWPEKVGVFIKY